MIVFLTHMLLLLFPGPLNMFVGNFNKYMAKAEGLAGNIWTHSKLHFTTFSTSFYALV